MVENDNSQSCAVSQQPPTGRVSNLLNQFEECTICLDKLPLEILQRVISHGSCKAMLALRRVCRRLYHACSNPCIVREIVKYSSRKYSSRKYGGVKRKSTCSRCHASISTLAWYDSVVSPKYLLSSSMRYALAREEFLPFLKSVKKDNLNDPHRLLQRRILSFLPQLIASHYPLRYDSQILPLLTCMFSELNQDIHPAVEQALTFCLAAATPGSYEKLRMMLYREANSPGLKGVWRYCPSDITTTQAQRIICGWQPLRRLHHGEPFPQGDQIPFASFMKIPPPFEPSSIENFASCHLPTMATPEFLIGDEWMGYYSYRRSNLTPLDPPMRGIIFERDHTQCASIPDIMPLSATGIDFVGTFTLRGEIDCRSGKFNFVKQYTHGPTWYWVGVMTPFGMVAKWSAGINIVVESGIRGWIWLWKAKWTHISS